MQYRLYAFEGTCSEFELRVTAASQSNEKTLESPADLRFFAVSRSLDRRDSVSLLAG